MFRKILFVLAILTGLSTSARADLWGQFRNSSGVKWDTLYLYGNFHDSLGLKETDGDSIAYWRFYQGSLFESTFVAFSTDRIWPGNFRRAFRASKTDGSTGGYAVRVLIWKNGGRASHNFDEGGWFTYSVTSAYPEVNVASSDTIAQVLTLGVGSNPVTVNVKQGSVPIAGVQVQVVDSSTQLATQVIGNTDANGVIKFNLNSGYYFVRLFKPGYIFTAPETLIVSGATSKNYSGTLFDPGTPSSPSLCRVYGWVFGLSADSLLGVTVTAEIKTSPLKAGSIVISPYLKAASTNSSGYWYLDLYPNSSLTPSTTKYEFTIYLSATPIAKRTLAVPNQSNWQFTW
ncbi:MAG: hypothetical protein L0196_07575 [candidate division Zixibacteria bacterium]|nr:hypothetical protein [candidate division Zixibacteria bacterium]